MGIRQKEKADMTRNELSDAMITLFMEKGYENTSIKDIAEQAGYSVGSFYRHWKSKQQAFMEFWDHYVSGFIRESVENAPPDCSLEEMIDYLIGRSETFSRNEITVKLYVTSQILSAMYEYEGVVSWSDKYREMLYTFIGRITGCRDEQRLASATNLVHIILDRHAMQYSSFTPSRHDIDSGTMKDCLIAMLAQL